jgi:hypothetical protein
LVREVEEDNMLPDRILKFASLPEPNREEELSGAQRLAVKAGLLHDALAIAELRGNKLSVQELDTIYYRCVELRWFQEARQALALRVPD